VLIWHHAGRVVAGMHLNEWEATDHLRALVGTAVPPERLADPSLGLAELAASVS
jgi:3-phenylpropionate/trans-cinnamate dioxygenase ferredoxin reductase subunit